MMREKIIILLIILLLSSILFIGCVKETISEEDEGVIPSDKPSLCKFFGEEGNTIIKWCTYQKV